MAGYKENKTDFDTVMKDITELFGLQAPNGEAEATNQADSKDVHPEGCLLYTSKIKPGQIHLSRFFCGFYSCEVWVVLFGENVKNAIIIRFRISKMCIRDRF